MDGPRTGLPRTRVEGMMTREELALRVVQYLADLRSGSFAVTDEVIAREPDATVRTVLGHLAVLHADLTGFRERDRLPGTGPVPRDREEELRKRTEALERSNAELEQFAHIASHDLQEPLRMVASYTELMAQRYQGKLDEKADKYIRYALEGARRMQALLSDLLAYSRVSGRGKPLALVDAADVVEDAIANLRIAIREANAEVTRDALPTILADPVQLVQVFQNLIGNAIKFRDGGPPLVHVSAERRGQAWIFSVRDNGIGIAAEHQERIFDPFQRLHERDKYPGTGMGLTISKRIVDRHGGRVWVESEPGKGSCFHFSILEADRSSGATS